MEAREASPQQAANCSACSTPQVTFHQGDGAKPCWAETALRPPPPQGRSGGAPFRCPSGGWPTPGAPGRGWPEEAAGEAALPSQKGQERGHPSALVLAFLRAPRPTGATPTALLQARAQGRGAGALGPGKDSSCPAPRHGGSQEVTHWRDCCTCSSRRHLVARDGPGLHLPEVVSTAGRHGPPRPPAQSSCSAAPGPRGPRGWAKLLSNHHGAEMWEALVSWAPKCCGNKGLSHGEGTVSPEPPRAVAARLFSFPKSSHWSPHTEPERVQSLHFYYFTFSANKSRCKQGLFHINILTGIFCCCCFLSNK